VIFPGVPFVVIGRGLDFVWSATSSRADNIDVFAETLCGGDDAHYLFRGECRAMTVFNAGELVRFDERAPLRFRETVHGPVIGYATARGGARVALALQRSTRGRELRSAPRFLRAGLEPGDLRSRLPQDHVRDRVLVRLVLRGQPRHRNVLERPAPGARARHGSVAPDRSAPADSSGAGS